MYIASIHTSKLAFSNNAFLMGQCVVNGTIALTALTAYLVYYNIFFNFRFSILEMAQKIQLLLLVTVYQTLMSCI